VETKIGDKNYSRITHARAQCLVVEVLLLELQVQHRPGRRRAGGHGGLDEQPDHLFVSIHWFRSLVHSFVRLSIDLIDSFARWFIHWVIFIDDSAIDSFVP
jgi:hypothetical protein